MLLNDGSVDIELRDEVIKLYDNLTGSKTSDYKTMEALVIWAIKWAIFLINI